MNTASYTNEEILAQLDECNRNYEFPMLDNGYRYLADVRLTAYRDSSRWAIVIETIAANPRTGGGEHYCLANFLYWYGNCLKPASSVTDKISVTSDGKDQPTFDEEYGWFANENARTIRIRDTVVPLKLDPQSLSTLGIVPEVYETEDDGKISGADLLRSLVPEHRELLLATDEELRQRVPSDLLMILRLDEWHHPDVLNDETPSQSPTFLMIADVLVTGDPSRYQPTMAPNTHWSNWPEGGTL